MEFLPHNSDGNLGFSAPAVMSYFDPDRGNEAVRAFVPIGLPGGPVTRSTDNITESEKTQQTNGPETTLFAIKL